MARILGQGQTTAQVNVTRLIIEVNGLFGVIIHGIQISGTGIILSGSTWEGLIVPLNVPQGFRGSRMQQDISTFWPTTRSSDHDLQILLRGRT
jgi:hypothetical protein